MSAARGDGGVVAVGLDFGGTTIKGCSVRSDGELVGQRSIPIGLEGGASDVVRRAAALARELGARERLGVGCAGLLDRERGVVLASPNLAPLAGVALAEGLATELGIAPSCVVLENDANVAALGEQWTGAARGERDVLVVTLGTGVGGGLILGGRLYLGAHGNAGEIGHVVVDPGGPACACGASGCLETLASANAARRRALERGLPQAAPGDLELLAERARRAAGPERALLLEVGRDLGRGLAAPATLLDLDCFVFAGGFAAALDVLEPGVRAGLTERRFGTGPIRLLPASLGGNAGGIGAARLALERR